MIFCSSWCCQHASKWFDPFCKLSVKVLVVTRRSFNSLGTCLHCFADRHGVPLLQRRIFTAKQSRTEGGGRLGSEYEATWPQEGVRVVDEVSK